MRTKEWATPGRKAPFLSSARAASLGRPSHLRETTQRLGVSVRLRGRDSTTTDDE